MSHIERQLFFQERPVAVERAFPNWSSCFSHVYNTCRGSPSVAGPFILPSLGTAARFRRILFRCNGGGYLPPLPVEVFRPAELCPLELGAVLLLVLPLNWAAFFAVTGMLLRPFVVMDDFRLLTLSLAILTCNTFFLTEVPCHPFQLLYTLYYIS